MAIDLKGKKVTYYGYTGMIDPTAVTRLCQALNIAVNKKSDCVYLCMSSLGGFVADGIVAAATRYSSANAMFMMHPTTVGPFAEGIPSERLQAALNTATADDERTERILRDRTQISDEMLKAKRLREVHFSPQDALKFGLIHDIREFTAPAGNELIQI